eukprot:Pgem_evm1s7371
MKLLLIFSYVNPEFWEPELRSIAEIHGFSIKFLSEINFSYPLLWIELESREHAKLIGQRSVLV